MLQLVDRSALSQVESTTPTAYLHHPAPAVDSTSLSSSFLDNFCSCTLLDLVKKNKKNFIFSLLFLSV